MSKILDQFNKAQLNAKIPAVNPGDTVRVFQKTQATAEIGGKKGKDEKAKHAPKTQVFEGLVIARKHGRGISSNITVRKVLQGVGVEKIFPVNSPSVEKIEIVKRGKVRRSKLYYLRTAKGKRAKLAKREDFKQAIAEIAPETTVEPTETKPTENAEKK